MRSVWKGLYFKKGYVIRKSSTLLSFMLKKKFLVHDGKSFKQLLVERHMIGLKLGEFIFTRKMRIVHKKKLLNKKGKKK